MGIIVCQKCGEQVDAENSHYLMGFQYCEKCYVEECRRLRDKVKNEKPQEDAEFLI